MPDTPFQYPGGPKESAPANTPATELLPKHKFTAEDAQLLADELNARPVLDLTTNTLPETVLPNASDEQLANLKAFILTVIASPEGKAAMQASLNS
jgi:hypothetical protein